MIRETGMRGASTRRISLKSVLEGLIHAAMIGRGTTNSLLPTSVGQSLHLLGAWDILCYAPP